MRCNSLSWFVRLAVVLALVRTGRADGLIFQLPADGIFAEFEGEQEATGKTTLPTEVEKQLTSEAKEKFRSLEKPQKTSVTCRVSSVGNVIRAQQACRWIEIANESQKKSRILKTLIPEKFLKRGEDPLDHTILTLWSPITEPTEKGFDQIQYELERRRSFFPRPLSNVEHLAKRTLTTPAGTYIDCEVLKGTTEFDEPLNNPSGRWVYATDWELTLHPDAPFGVVELRGKSVGREYTGEDGFTEVRSQIILTLTRFGQGAASQLPQPEVKKDAK